MFLLRPFPHIQQTTQQPGLPCPHKYLRLCPLLHNRCDKTAPTKKEKKMAEMKEQIKALEKIHPSNEEIANLSDAQFKTPVIRMLTKMVEYGHKIEEEVKATQSEKKESIQGTNSERKET